MLFRKGRNIGHHGGQACPLKMAKAPEDLYGKDLILKIFNQMKIIFVLASIRVLSC